MPQEVFWGLHFFNETLFEAVPDLLEKVERVLAQFYPGERWVVPPFFQFGSWIGGDRDGNPFVTNDVTHGTLLENRLTGLRRYRRRIDELVRALSITEKAVPISDRFRAALERELAATGQAEEIATRNPGEVFRQYLACMLRRIQLMIEHTERGDTRPDPAGYASADALLADLRLMEDELVEDGRPELAAALRASGAPRGRVVPLQHRPAGRPREYQIAKRSSPLFAPHQAEGKAACALRRSAYPLALRGRFLRTRRRSQRPARLFARKPSRHFRNSFSVV